MSTNIIKTRINLSVSKDKEAILKALAKEAHMPVATKIMNLVDFALEFEEDKMLHVIAKERKNSGKKEKNIDHATFWKKARR
jgi:hypothetical protein